jgi:hypothetical protein
MKIPKHPPPQGGGLVKRLKMNMVNSPFTPAGGGRRGALEAMLKACERTAGDTLPRERTACRVTRGTLTR